MNAHQPQLPQDRDVSATNGVSRRFFLQAAAAASGYVLLAPGRANADTQPDHPQEIPMPSVLMPIGDATEIMDTLYPFFRLPEDGFEIVVAGPQARLYHGVLHEVPPDGNIPWDITREQPAYHIQATVAFKDVDPRKYVGLFLSGGRAPEYLRYDQDLMRITRHFFEANKPVGMTCHGVEIAAAAGCLKGRRATTVAKCALDITAFGGTYVETPVVIDGNLISSRTWHDYSAMFKPFMAALKRAVSAAP